VGITQARTLLLDVAKLHTSLQDGPGVVYALELAVRASEAVHGTHANIVAKLCRRLGEAREVCVTRHPCYNFNAFNFCLIPLVRASCCQRCKQLRRAVVCYALLLRIVQWAPCTVQLECATACVSNAHHVTP
jgi:hypothetical protein